MFKGGAALAPTAEAFSDNTSPASSKNVCNELEFTPRSRFATKQSNQTFVALLYLQLRYNIGVYGLVTSK